MIAKILIILSAFAVYVIAAPYSARQDVGGGAYAAVGAEVKPTEALFLTPSSLHDDSPE
ncbi:hypothetical protein P692DRAFT_20831942 [Suillus brevipes Sb2]|nr:hypothetical protein P692DRAFT_20831942 [Suillus brevipes Sb2]